MLLCCSRENIEIFHMYFGHSVLYRVGISPGSGAQLSFEIKFCAFADITFGHVGLSIDHHYSVPLGALRYVDALRRTPGTFGCGERKLSYRALLHVAYLRITPHITHKNYFIYRHLLKI